MKILVTGANGFIGKNLICGLKNRGFSDIYEYDVDTDPNNLDIYTENCEFVFHLAGVNRSEINDDFMDGNFGFTSILLDKLKENGNKSPILISSSIQAAFDNVYGKSKKAGEDYARNYGIENGVKTYIYRLTNVFGKWCRPNYNSVIATFCHNIANGLDIAVNDPTVELKLIYIDDVVNEFVALLENSADFMQNNENFYSVKPVHTVTLGEIAELIYSFKESRQTLRISDQSDGFAKKLYATYLSYLPKNEFSYPLKMNTDERGSFTEFIKTPDRGQVSVNVSKPHIVKGNHWHNTKNEKFLVVSGKGVIRFRKPHDDEIIECFVSAEKLEVVDIPPGYTHNIENLGDTDMVTIMWANEEFNKANPDTYFLEI